MHIIIYFPSQSLLLTVPVSFPSRHSPILQGPVAKLGRLKLPWALFAYPFYLWRRSPGKQGSHYDPNCDLFTPGEKNMVRHSWATIILS